MKKREEFSDRAECHDDIDDLDLMEFLEKYDVKKPAAANRIVVSEELMKETDYQGEVYGFIREDSGYHVILGWKNKMPGEELNAKRIGYIGRMDDPQLEYPFIRGEWENGILAFYMVCLSNGKELKDKLEVEVYTLKQDLFSRNSGLIETDWMDDKCVVLAGLGSVGSCIALQLARSGMQKFVLIDPDCVEIHNVCRHQCNLTDVGRYKVDAVKDRILQINPNAEVRCFYRAFQNVRSADYEDWISPANTLFVGTCDNLTGNAFVSDIAESIGAPFASMGFRTRCWAGQIFVSIPERGDKPYRTAFQKQISDEAVQESRNHYYVGEDAVGRTQIIPGLDVDIEYGVSLFNKIILDIINRNNDNYQPRILHTIQQFIMFSGSELHKGYEPEKQESFWKAVFPKPISLRNVEFQ